MPRAAAMVLKSLKLSTDETSLLGASLGGPEDVPAMAKRDVKMLYGSCWGVVILLVLESRKEEISQFYQSFSHKTTRIRTKFNRLIDFS